MIAHMSYVLCDNCGAPGGMGDDYREARMIATRDGFRRVSIDGVAADLCPRCKRLDLAEATHGR